MGDGGCSGAIQRQDPPVDFGKGGARRDSGTREQPLAQAFCGHKNMVSSFGGCALAWQTPGWRLATAPGHEKRLPLPFPLTAFPLRSSQMSWTPGWMLEDGTLGQGAVLASEDAQACDICQEIFPSDAAGQADYLKHVLAHMK